MGSIAENSGGGCYSYRMSKTALNMFCRSFSIDYPKIISIALHPGWVKTDMGGSNAITTIEESAIGLAKIMLDAKRKSSGGFFDFEENELPW
jgi:NAD(P)-dependent dehydrogenase (short-subunit alcohol dehydrogenase family)